MTTIWLILLLIKFTLSAYLLGTATRRLVQLRKRRQRAKEQEERSERIQGENSSGGNAVGDSSGGSGGNGGGKGENRRLLHDPRARRGGVVEMELGTGVQSKRSSRLRMRMQELPSTPAISRSEYQASTLAHLVSCTVSHQNLCRPPFTYLQRNLEHTKTL